MALVGLWSLAMHWVLAITNSCNALKYVTRFSYPGTDPPRLK
ncbi:hypothetical protein M7I_5854 [Glarea lozoyensis 74030]|uniref:Uncharacterized protein n=1 Tax=Glarea lozoyensis (strain ATCC 74030 / MF5533) TaxID=1104152 RepID=H0ESY0_GLAL7|nr:hypothetical protein M7I_5854 [Glarea lozoyensis 74030]